MDFQEKLSEFSHWLQTEYGDNTPPNGLKTDGQFHPLEVDDALRYAIFLEHNYALVWDWREGTVVGTFHTSDYQTLSRSERQAAERDQDKQSKLAKLRQKDEWKKRAEELALEYSAFPLLKEPVGYLAQKNVKLCGDIRLTKDGQAAVMYLDVETGNFATYQVLLDKDHLKKGRNGKTRNKDFPKNSQASDVFAMFGFPPVKNIEEAKRTECFICEGVATALSVHEATGKPTICVGMARNLESVAPHFTNGIIIADYDALSETGQTKASTVGLPYIVMKDPQNLALSTDANDYANRYSVEALGRFINHEVERLDKTSALFPDTKEWMQKKEKVTWLLEDFLTDQPQLMGVFGAPYCGKSSVVESMVFALAAGKKEWGGKLIERRCKVAYFLGEGQLQFHSAVEVYTKSNSLEGEELDAFYNNLKIYEEGLDFLDKNDFTSLVEKLGQELRKPNIIVLDTLNLFMSGDENNTEVATDVVKKFLALANKYKLCVCYVTHTSKDPEKQEMQRGNGAFFGACFNQYKVEPLADRGFQITCKKLKGGVAEWSMKFKKNVVETGELNNFGKPITAVYLTSMDGTVAAAPKVAKPKKIDPNEISDRAVFKSLMDKNFDEASNSNYRIDKDVLWRHYFTEEDEAVLMDFYKDNQKKAMEELKKAKDKAKANWATNGRKNIYSRCLERGWFVPEFDDQGRLSAILIDSIDLNKILPLYWIDREKDKIDKKLAEQLGI